MILNPTFGKRVDGSKSGIVSYEDTKIYSTDVEYIFIHKLLHF